MASRRTAAGLAGATLTAAALAALTAGAGTAAAATPHTLHSAHHAPVHVRRTAPVKARPVTHHQPVHRPVVHHPNVTGATHDLTNILAHVSTLAHRAATGTEISTSDAASLQAALSVDAAAVKADLAALPAATTEQQVRRIVASAQRAGDVADGQYGVTAAADRTGAGVEFLAGHLEELTGQLDAAAAAGVDVSKLTPLLTELNSNLATAASASSASVAAVDALTPTSPDSAGRPVISDMVTAYRALRNAQGQYDALRNGLAQLLSHPAAPAAQ